MRVRLSAHQQALAETYAADVLAAVTARRARDHFRPVGITDAEQKRQYAGAEIAVCVCLGGWLESSAGLDHTCDVRVGTIGYQVRWTRHSAGHLCLHQWDKPDHTFVLVTGWLPTFEVVGTLYAARGMVEDHQRERDWWVPQSELLAIEALLERDVEDAYHQRPMVGPAEQLTFLQFENRGHQWH